MRGVVNGVTVYDDLRTTRPPSTPRWRRCARAHRQGAHLAVLEPRSNTMKLGVHRDTHRPALAAADRVLLFSPSDLGWNSGAVVQGLNGRGQVYDSVEASSIRSPPRRVGGHMLVMSNGGFENIHPRLLARLAEPSPGKPVRL